MSNKCPWCGETPPQKQKFCNGSHRSLYRLKDYVRKVYPIRKCVCSFCGTNFEVPSNEDYSLCEECKK